VKWFAARFKAKCGRSKPPSAATEVDLFQAIRQGWLDDGHAVPPGVPPEELAAFEKRHGVALPPSMRAYFQTADGNCDMGNDYFTFWRLRDVKLVSEENADTENTDRPDYMTCFVFADYLICGWLYAVQLTGDPAGDGPVYLVNGKQRTVVADSFLDFMRKYAEDPDSLY
jgi:hypothetical protein